MKAQGQRWKRQERQIAAALGGARLPNNGRNQPDVVAGRYAVRVKTRASLPDWFTNAVAQAVQDAGPGRVPLVVFTAVRPGVRVGRYVVLGFDAWTKLLDELNEEGGDA